MLFFYYGNDFEKRQNQVQNMLKTLKEKRKGANFFHYDSFDIDQENLKELTKSQGLFETKNIVFLTNIFINKNLKEWILENIKELKKSDSAFVFSEENLTADEIKKIEKNSFHFKEFKKTTIKEKSLFRISDFIQKKDKKNAWKFYQESIQAGIESEKLYSVILWNLNALSISKKLSETESGLKSFVYQKAKNSLKNWNENEIRKKSYELLKIHSEFRRGKLNLKNALEKFLLEL